MYYSNNWIVIYKGTVLTMSDLEVIHAVALAQLDLKHFQSTDIGCQPSQTLLATAPHSHQQSIASGCFKDAVNTTPRGVEKWSYHSRAVGVARKCGGCG